MKLNKIHGGKEFSNSFIFVGQVKNSIKGMADERTEVPIYQQTKTKTEKPRRVLTFDIQTDKSNRLKIELAGMEQMSANAFSSSEKKNIKVPWANRHDKSILPNSTYHLIEPEWDRCENIAAMLTDNKGQLKDNQWVLVKGKYDFYPFTNDEGKTFNILKREIGSIEPIENGQEIKVGKNTIEYVCDFNSPDFKEINSFFMEYAVNSVYQDEETRDTLINAVFLGYGKEASVPHPFEMKVYYKESSGEPLADAFAKLQFGDFHAVRGVDNNRAEFTEVEDESNDDDFDPFADVAPDEKEAKTHWAVSGTRKGLEVVMPVGKVHRGTITREEITPAVEYETDNPFGGLDVEDDDDLYLPF